MSTHWKDFVEAAHLGEPKQVPVGLIVDSPWLPGYSGIDTRDYFLFPDKWLEINLGLRKAWDLLLTDRYTLAEICEELNSLGFTRSNGFPWAWDDPRTAGRRNANNRLHEIFHNPFYAGWVVSERYKIAAGEVRAALRVIAPSVWSSSDHLHLTETILNHPVERFVEMLSFPQRHKLN